MAGCESEHVVSVDWLKQQLDQSNTRVRVLDATLHGQDNYKKGHIPGAAFFDILYKGEHTEHLQRNLPSPEHFEEAARLAGIDADSHVIVYDASDTGGLHYAGRAWWMFYIHGHEKTSVLNGGLGKWLQKGFPVSIDTPVLKEGDFQASARKDVVVGYDTVFQNLTTRHYQLVDTRPENEFTGAEGGDPRFGHIPGCVSIPLTEFLDQQTGLLKDLPSLKKLLLHAGIDLDKPTIGTCNTATTVSTVALLAKMLHKPDVLLYLGSFEDWRRRAPAEQIIRGNKPT